MSNKVFPQFKWFCSTSISRIWWQLQRLSRDKSSWGTDPRTEGAPERDECHFEVRCSCWKIRSRQQSWRVVQQGTEFGAGAEPRVRWSFEESGCADYAHVSHESEAVSPAKSFSQRYVRFWVIIQYPGVLEVNLWRLLLQFTVLQANETCLFHVSFSFACSQLLISLFTSQWNMSRSRTNTISIHIFLSEIRFIWSIFFELFSAVKINNNDPNCSFCRLSLLSRRLHPPLPPTLRDQSYFSIVLDWFFWKFISHQSTFLMV